MNQKSADQKNRSRGLIIQASLYVVSVMMNMPLFLPGHKPSRSRTGHLNSICTA
ncbi:hypothetical protein K504DRAFT_458001, partial [Pleomassaria siparia CBS 279.74]